MFGGPTKRVRVPVPLLIVLVLAIAARVLAMVTVWPATIIPNDPGVYVDGAQRSLFNDLLHPAGYPLLLRALHEVSGTVAAITITQHLLGFATGLLAYGIARRVGLSPLLAALAVVPVLLSEGALYLEHVLLTECLFTFLLFAGLYLAVRAAEPGRRAAVTIGLAVAAGAVLALSGWTRTVATFLVPALALWILWAVPLRGKLRFAAAGGTLAAGAAVLIVYALASQHYTGAFGLSQGGGWAAYARVAQFADCTKFDPPAGTKALCETTPSSERPGPTYYHWYPDSPAHRTFGYPPKGNAQLGRFGRKALLAQPGDYLEAVATDFARYAFPSAGERPNSGGDFSSLDVDYDNPEVRASFARQFAAYYPDLADAKVSSGSGTLSTVTSWLNLRGVVLVALAVLSIVGAILTRGARRKGVVLAGGMALLLCLVPVATLIYNARYAVPAYGLFAIGGLAGLAALVPSRGARAPEPRAAAR